MTASRLVAGVTALVASVGLAPALAPGLVAAAAPTPVVVTGTAAPTDPHSSPYVPRPGVTASTTPAPVPTTTPPAPPAPSGPSAEVVRLRGADRYATAVAASRYRFPRHAAAVYLVSGTTYTDAVAVGAAADGPVLLVPPRGPVPAAVVAEVRRLAPGRVYAVGGRATVPDAALRAVAQGRPTARLAGADRYATAVAVTRHLFPRPVPLRPGGEGTPLPQAVLVDDAAGLDALLAGVAANRRMAVLPLPADGTVPAVVRAEARRLGLSHVAATTPVMRSARALMAGRGTVETASQADRFSTAALMSWFGGTFFAIGGTAYVARSDAAADLVAAGPLDGLLLLARPDGTMPHGLDLLLTGVRRLVVIGDVSDSAVRRLRRATVDPGSGPTPVPSPMPTDTATAAPSAP